MEQKIMKGGLQTMENKQIFGFAALALVAMLCVGFVSAQGFGFMNQNLTDEERETMQAQHDAIREAVENNDFDTWQSLMSENIDQMRASITEEQFNQMVEHHQTMEQFRTAVEELKASGDYTREDIDALREEYGVENGPGFGNGFKQGPGHGGQGQGAQGNCPFAE